MAFDPDHDLVSDFNELIGGKKKGTPIDFEFSEKNAKSLDFGFDSTSKGDPIEEGGKRILGKKDGRRKKRSKPLGKGANFIKDNL